MIEELGVTDNPDRVGFYSGLVVSLVLEIRHIGIDNNRNRSSLSYSSLLCITGRSYQSGYDFL